MRIYLDNCCFNRPFDDQSGVKVKLETDAKLYVQSLIRVGEIELGWSYMLDFENSVNPFPERKFAIGKWKQLLSIDTGETKAILLKAEFFVSKGIKAKDALHVACAIETKCNYFLTTDSLIIKKLKDENEIMVINPIEFINIIEEYDNGNRFGN